MSDFPSAELHHGLHAITFPQEPNRVILLEVVIVIVRIRPELELFDVDDVLLSFGVVTLLFLLVLPLAIVHGLGYRRLRRRRDHDQIEAEVLCLAHCGRRRHNLHGAVWKYSANFTSSDRFVYVLSNLGARQAKRSVWIHSARMH